MSLISRLFNRKGQDVSIEEEKPFARDTEDEVLDEDEDEIEENSTIELGDNPDSEEVYEVLEREIHPAKIICPDCGGITLEGFEYCDKCGGELSQ